MTTVSDATDRRERIPLTMPANILAAARAAHAAHRDREDRERAADEAEQAARQTVEAEPFRQLLLPQLGELGTALPWAFGPGEATADIGDTRLVIVTRRPKDGDYYNVYGWWSEQERQTATIVTIGGDDLRDAVLRTVHDLAGLRAARPSEPTPPGDLPAYPCDGGNGLTIRDRFAVAVLPAVYAEDLGSDFLDTARITYGIADQMLTARSEPAEVVTAAVDRYTRVVAQ